MELGQFGILGFSTSQSEKVTPVIHSIVKSFGDGAYNAKRAGFDGVEIHAVHEGYLLDGSSMRPAHSTGTSTASFTILQ